MAQPFARPVEDSVPKVAGEVAVGEDLEFQRKWWTFERAIWIFFLILLCCDLIGLFGRGYLSKAKKATPDKALTLSYERIERASTPSIMTLHFSPSAVHEGKIQVFVSESVICGLGAQCIAPQPETSTLTNGGITYTFAAASAPTTMEIQLQPSIPGTQHIRVQALGSDPIDVGIFVFP